MHEIHENRLVEGIFKNIKNKVIIGESIFTKNYKQVFLLFVFHKNNCHNIVLSAHYKQKLKIFQHSSQGLLFPWHILILIWL